MEIYDAYKLMGIGQSSTSEEVSRAFKRRSKELHPDHGGSNAEFQRLVTARDIIVNRMNNIKDELQNSTVRNSRTYVISKEYEAYIKQRAWCEREIDLHEARMIDNAKVYIILLSSWIIAMSLSFITLIPYVACPVILVSLVSIIFSKRIAKHLYSTL